MAGLRFNIDADLTRFSQLVKRIQEVRKEMEKLSKFSPKYNKLYDEFKKIKSELDTMQAKFAEIQTALAQVDISKGIVDSSKKIRHETEETSETIKHYADSLNGIKEHLKQVTNEINSMSEAERKSASGENVVKQYANLKAQLKVAADEMRSFAKEQENVIKIQQASDGSLTQLRRQLSLLTAQYDNLSRDLRTGATGRELIVQIQTVTKELNEAEQASMRFYRNVGNYASGWNGLNVQVQQLARELPSLAVSMNTFFLAISNNLPMLIDEIKLAQERLRALKEEGKQGTPVWKQLASSLLSWQTALVVGITLLSTYGKEISDWVKGLFKAKENIDVLQESLKAYNEAVSEGRKNAQSELTELKLLYDTAIDAAQSTDERTKAIRKLKDEYPDYFQNLSNEAILAGEAKEAYDALSTSVLNYSRAQAIVQRMVKNNERLSELSDTIDNAKRAYSELAKESNESLNFIGSGIAAQKAQEQLKIIQDAREETERLMASNSKLQSEFNAVDFLTNPEQAKTTKKGSSFIDAYQQQKAIREAEQDILDTITESQLKSQKVVIDMMEEGNAKELALINANYDAKILDIEKREKELLKVLQDAEYERWKEQNKDYKKKGLQFTPTITKLPQDKQSIFDAEYSAALKQRQNDIEKLLSGVLSKYRDFAAQREAIERQMNDDITFLQSQRTEANADEIDRAIQVAKDKAKEAIKAITDEENKALAGQDNTFIKMLFGDVSQMGFSELTKLIEQARQLMDYLSGNGSKEGITFITPEQLEAIQKSPAELSKMQKALDKLLGTNKKSPFENIFESFRKGLAELQSAKGFKEISGAIGNMASAANMATKELSGMFDAIGNTALSDALNGVQSLMSAVSNIGQGFAKGGLVGGIASVVGEAANFIGQALTANKRHKEALEQVMNEAISQQREYNLLLLEQNLLYEKGNTIFGDNTYSRAKNAVDNLRESIQQLNDATSELYGVEVKTGHKKTGLFGWGKGKDIFTPILEIYPELIDANGEFNKELARTIINTREMSEEDKNALQGMIDLAEQAEEAFESLNDYLTDIFGNLGNDMSNALVDAFKNGTDAAESFTQSVSNMLESLAEQMIYSVTLAPLLEDAQADMMDIMQNTGLSDQEKFKKWAGILNGLVDEAVSQQEIANKLYEAYQQAAEGQGFDLFKPESQQQQKASSGGFETMSQDSADELNGRFTALQMIGEEIKGLNGEQVDALRQIYEALSGESYSDVVSLVPSVSDAPDIASQTRRVMNESYRPEINVAFPTAQFDALVSRVTDMCIKVDDLVRFGAENIMSVQTIEENTGKIAKQIPQQGESIVRTINNKL